MHDAIPTDDTSADDTAPDDTSIPRLDEDGLLRLGGRWVAIPDAQLPVVALLVTCFGRVVRREALVAAYVSAGHSGNEASIRSLVSRISQRVAQLGLRLHTVRGRGVLLGPDDPSLD